MRRHSAPALLLIAALLAGCDWPKDPAGTSERIEGGILRVGVSDNPPWVRLNGPQVTGIEADLVRTIAADMHARILWVQGSEGGLMEAAKEYKVDLVAAGLTDKNPWAKELGMPRPYGEFGGEKHILLTPPGENGWLLRLDRILHGQKPAMEARLAAETSP